MNMLANFFDIQKDSRSLFEGLDISKESVLCAQWMNQWPTLFLSFKDVDGTCFENAFNLLKATLSRFCDAHPELADNDKVTEEQQRGLCPPDRPDGLLDGRTRGTPDPDADDAGQVWKACHPAVR